MDWKLKPSPGEDQDEPTVDLQGRVWALWLAVLWSPSTVYGVCNLCASFHLLLLEMISMNSFLRGLAISVKLHVENECL